MALSPFIRRNSLVWQSSTLRNAFGSYSNCESRGTEPWKVRRCSCAADWPKYIFADVSWPFIFPDLNIIHCHSFRCCRQDSWDTLSCIPQKLFLSLLSIYAHLINAMVITNRLCFAVYVWIIYNEQNSSELPPYPWVYGSSFLLPSTSL